MIKLKKIKAPTQKGVDIVGPGFPSLYLDEERVSEIKDWEVGKTYRLMVDIVMKSKSEEQDHDVNGRFDLVGYKVMMDKSMADMTDKEFGEMQGEMLAHANQH